MEQLGKHFKKIAGAALTRHGFAYADLLAHWPDILGPELSRHCLPEKLSFPRDPSGTAKTGGTLTLRARFGRALDVQYSAPAIIERVNAYCGYNVVVALKVLQGALPEPPAPPPAPPVLGAAQRTKLDQELAGLGDGRLKDALSRLGASAMAAKKRPLGR
jgi:hypothetical protein